MDGLLEEKYVILFTSPAVISSHNSVLLLLLFFLFFLRYMATIFQLCASWRDQIISVCLRYQSLSCYKWN